MKSKLLILIALVICACGSNTSITGAWTNKEKIESKNYNSVFIAVLSSNTAAKILLEDQLGYDAQQAGIKVIKSHNTFRSTFTKENKPSKEDLLSVIKGTNSETIFTVVLKDKESETRYVPGTTNYAMGYTPLGYYNYYGNFWGYYNTIYPYAYDPGYYTTDKIYYLESNLYDANTEELLWSAQSKTYNPSDLDSFVESYTKVIMKELVKDGIFKSNK
ncbi:hypothetical protein MQE36_04570 [Zhouia spongiae]|uniref:DUF4136 domain-containing protein n=1 Tax=Zhouia spongiae TaxID=2202721 RepID=A0ABY3YP46_9FLAO|nr:hypothetical protein [Zhouia spongiae]UNY99622.1 hypothetical protein MQE36_04570 [Zhouia spongiae]